MHSRMIFKCDGPAANHWFWVLGHISTYTLPGQYQQKQCPQKQEEIGVLIHHPERKRNKVDFYSAVLEYRPLVIMIHDCDIESSDKTLIGVTLTCTEGSQRVVTMLEVLFCMLEK